VRADQEALEELLALGSRSTPTTVIDGEVIIGYDRHRISERLGIKE
jgi:glutaredoxin